LRGSGGRWAALLGLAFIVALGIAILAIAPGMRQAGVEYTGASSIPLPSEPTARRAYALAQKEAHSWQPDIHLVGLSAHWRPVRGRWPTQTVWTAQFYSPAAGQIALIVVEGGQARRIQEMLALYTPATLAEEQWQVDSPKALEIWWKHGGERFLAGRAGVEVAARLQPAGPQDPSPVWSITAVVGEQAYVVTIRATDGAVIP